MNRAPVTTEDACLGPLFDWIEDESLFSWAAGYHLTTKANSSADTSERLFGRRYACRKTDISSGIDYFACVTKGMLGRRETILAERTALKEWWPFFSEQRRAALLSNTVESTIRSRAGMHTATGASPGRLKYCASCVREQIKTWGRPTWRMRHLPSASLACSVHQEALRFLPHTSSIWHLPELTTSHCAPDLSSVELEAALLLCATVDAITRYGEPIDLDMVRSGVMSEWVSMGVVPSPARIPQGHLTKWFASTKVFACLKAVSRAANLVPDGDWIPMLLRARSLGSPCAWTLILAALTEHLPPKERPRALYGMLEHGNGSNAQIPLWPDAAVIVSLRYSAAFANSETRFEVAQKLGVPVSAVNRMLKVHPSLKLAWRSGLHSKKVEECVRACEDFLSANPKCMRKDLLLECGTPVAWLQIHAPERLLQVLRRIPTDRDRQKTLFHT